MYQLFIIKLKVQMKNIVQSIENTEKIAKKTNSLVFNEVGMYLCIYLCMYVFICMQGREDSIMGPFKAPLTRRDVM
jgi:hypothetical protein